MMVMLKPNALTRFLLVPILANRISNSKVNPHILLLHNCTKKKFNKSSIYVAHLIESS